MSTLTLRLPNSLHDQLRKLARREGVSVERLLETAAAEKISALTTAEYFEARGARGSRAAYEAVLARVPDIEPEPHDKP
jgi:hypothetical protein